MRVVDAIGHVYVGDATEITAQQAEGQDLVIVGSYGSKRMERSSKSTVYAAARRACQVLLRRWSLEGLSGMLSRLFHQTPGCWGRPAARRSWDVVTFTNKIQFHDGTGGAAGLRAKPSGGCRILRMVLRYRENRVLKNRIDHANYGGRDREGYWHVDETST